MLHRTKIIHAMLSVYGVVCVTLLVAVPSASAALTEDAPADLRLDFYADPVSEDARSSGWLFVTEDADGRRLWSQTKMMFGIGVVAVGVLYVMPESITGWDRDVSISELPDRWWRNVSRGPIWDNDDWFFNYVAHPYCGGVYYQMARKSGYNQWDAFLYTTIMSTFFWEYGIEAFAEVPSLQDIIVTPLGGWIYGEWAFRREKAIRANQGLVLGSKTLGHLSLFFLDPIDYFGMWVNSLVGREWVVTGSVALAPVSGENSREIFSGGHSPRLTVGLSRSF